MSETVRKNNKIIGILVLILGIAGLFLPAAPGWILILAGLALL